MYEGTFFCQRARRNTMGHDAFHNIDEYVWLIRYVRYVLDDIIIIFLVSPRVCGTHVQCMRGVVWCGVASCLFVVSRVSQSLSTLTQLRWFLSLVE